ncbi:aldehyde dehydrogenase family protein [Profundibacterium mesophilum]|uniref:Aldehyde dehydrogenase n=1 Tax=Profundibacterium mesophilum KAUST100406-0324 TaxID=1037889 RepID=A0A921NNV6_9RHOB|nr:aldehyde dehydrogenase family protein [Profundibacterium mesophilum]KAF0674557.1 aldehyde dehydrogenase [Profundibacterium mesophilum KAUST100406-0324]
MTVAQIFDSMEYGPAPESAAEAQAWLEAHGRMFGHWIGGAARAGADHFDSRSPADGTLLARIAKGDSDAVEAAVTAARGAQEAWAAHPAKRARALYALARLIQKNARLFAVLESLDSGKPIRESRDIDIPQVIRHFYYHAGMAQIMEEAVPGRVPHGVCGQIVPWNFPLLMAAWKIAPALAMGNTVVLKPAEWTPLSALLLAELSAQAGLPAGVLNVVTGDGETGAALVAAPVDKIAFTGSTEVGRAIRRATAGSGKALTLELGGKSPYLVFDDADLDSAVEGLVDAIFFNGGQVCCAGSRLLVQEGISEDFHARLIRRMQSLRVGDPLDKCIDVGAIVDPVQRDRIAAMVDAGGGTVHRAGGDLPGEGCFYPPTLVTGLSGSDPLMQEEIFGPVLVSTTFRTPAEAVQLANDTRYGLAASVWSENINLALGVAPAITAGVVWINGANMFDAAAPFGGLRESGFGREGGPEGLAAYTRAPHPARQARPIAAVEAPRAGQVRAPALDRTAKLYIGGKQVRPDGGYSRPVWSKKGALLGHAPQANRKDLRNAVEAARAASGWSAMAGHQRAQILYYIGENLSARAEEFAARIAEMTGGSAREAEAEMSVAVDRCFTWAAWADKHDGAARDVPVRGMALALKAPVGVIGQFAPDEVPLAGLISIVAPAIALGNRVICVASEPYPLAATDFYQVLDTSDVPAGVVNILTGPHEELAPQMAGHMGIDAVWSFSGRALSQVIEQESAADLKRSWVSDGMARDWLGPEGQGARFRDEATETRTVWIPYGEGTITAS